MSDRRVWAYGLNFQILGSGLRLIYFLPKIFFLFYKQDPPSGVWENFYWEMGGQIDPLGLWGNLGELVIRFLLVTLIEFLWLLLVRIRCVMGRCYSWLPGYAYFENYIEKPLSCCCCFFVDFFGVEHIS